MKEPACPKCGETMDEGTISWSGSGSSGYVSKKQTGMLRSVTPIREARACTKCGYVEMNLDPQELKKKIT